MKGLKLSKTSWLILSAGVFMVVLAGLGLTRSQQMSEQSKLDDELSLSEKQLGAVQTTSLSQRLETLQAQVEESTAQLKEAQARLHQTVVSVDVADEFFQVAAACSVNITSLSTTAIAQSKYEGIPSIATASITARVIGEKKNIIKFVITLNNDYRTGNVESAQVQFDNADTQDDTPDAGEGTGDGTDEVEMLQNGLANATVNLLIYSYEGK
jgi:hypothetical protein